MIQPVLFWGRSYKAFQQPVVLWFGIRSWFSFRSLRACFSLGPLSFSFTPGLWEDCPRLACMVIFRTVPLSTVAYANSASLCKWPLSSRSPVCLHSAAWVHFLPEPACSPLLVVLSCPSLRWPRWCPRCLVSPGEPLTVCSCISNTRLSAALNSVELGLNLCLFGSFCCL